MQNYVNYFDNYDKFNGCTKLRKNFLSFTIFFFVILNNKRKKKQH